jgi:jasmonate ZIM domain-containing protein
MCSQILLKLWKILQLQAIMLLAGSRNTKSSSYTNLPGSRGASATATTAHPFLAPIIIPQATRTPSSSVPSTAHTTAVTTAPTTTARPSSSASPGILTRPIARNVHTVTELPQARKASLARFLEKRKDRYLLLKQHWSLIFLFFLLVSKLTLTLQGLI